MIKLMFFAPCEKVIEARDNSTSLIAVLEHFNVRGDVSGDIPQNAGLPFTWSVVALWHRDEDVQEPTDFETKIELRTPSGEFAMGVDHLFTVSNDYFNFRNQMNFPIFPIGEEGTYKLTLDYRKYNAEQWERAGEYPIRVYYTRENIKNENGNETVNEITDEQPVEGISSVSGTGKKTRIGSKKRHSKKGK